MAAYVGFDKYTGAPTDLKDTVVEAKRAKTHIDKTAEDTDKVVRNWTYRNIPCNIISSLYSYDRFKS